MTIAAYGVSSHGQTPLCEEDVHIHDATNIVTTATTLSINPNALPTAAVWHDAEDMHQKYYETMCGGGERVCRRL